MRLRQTPSLAVDRIVIDDTTVPGFSVNTSWFPSRIAGKPFRGTSPGFTRVETHHDGTHPHVDQAHTWRTDVAYHPNISSAEQYRKGDQLIFLVFPNDQLIRVTLAHTMLQTAGMEYPIDGIWQLIELKRPGHRGTLALPRLLVSFEVRQSPIH